MNSILDLVHGLLGNWDSLLGKASAIVAALLSIAMIIPGDQPDKVLQSLLDFIKKYSKK